MFVPRRLPLNIFIIIPEMAPCGQKPYFNKTCLASQLKTCLQNLVLCYANVTHPFLLAKYMHKDPKHSEEEIN